VGEEEKHKDNKETKYTKHAYRLLELLLWAELVAMATLPLTAVCGTRGETSLERFNYSVSLIGSLVYIYWEVKKCEEVLDINII